jgi:hypothetical protein
MLETLSNQATFFFCTIVAKEKSSTFAIKLQYMKNTVFLFATGIVFTGLLGCGKDDGPQLTLIEPTNHQAYARGTDIHFDMQISSEEELADCRIYLHKESGAGWIFDSTYVLTGKNIEIHHHDMVIPPDAAVGEYHLDVTVRDVAGKSAKRDVHIDITE